MKLLTFLTIAILILTVTINGQSIYLEDMFPTYDPEDLAKQCKNVTGLSQIICDNNNFTPNDCLEECIFNYLQMFKNKMFDENKALQNLRNKHGSKAIDEEVVFSSIRKCYNYEKENIDTCKSSRDFLTCLISDSKMGLMWNTSKTCQTSFFLFQIVYKIMRRPQQQLS